MLEAVARARAIAPEQRAGKEMLVLSGDSHNAWYNHLRLEDGSLAGAGFAVQSVTSSG